MTEAVVKALFSTEAPGKYEDLALWRLLQNRCGTGLYMRNPRVPHRNPSWQGPEASQTSDVEHLCTRQRRNRWARLCGPGKRDVGNRELCSTAAAI